MRIYLSSWGKNWNARSFAPLFFFGFDFELVIYFVFPCDLTGLGSDCVLLLLTVDWPFQTHLAVLGNNLDVFTIHRQRTFFQYGLPDLLS
jgi:hypothetical protein